MIDQLISYLAFPFVRHALIVGILVSLCASLLGVTLVLKRYSYIGDGLSHVAFGAMAIATVINVTGHMLVVLPITVVSAILLLRAGQNAKIKGDAALAMISVGSLAAGYLLLNVFSSSSNVSGDVCTTLFGSTRFLTLSGTDVIVCAALAILVLLVYVLFYNKIFSVTFDESFAKASGVNAGAYNLLIATITAVVIVLSMRLVGSLLISALVIFPAVSAMRLFKNFKAVVICSAIFSVVCAAVGLCVSILAETPTGATIVLTDAIAFLICLVIEKIKKRA
ncbi:MAG: metal ABC transporter permease [Clostridia bacterium]|nr:metal ABC transporter permease [Clostridia bacterium]